MPPASLDSTGCSQAMRTQMIGESAAAASAAKVGAAAVAKMPFFAKLLILLGMGAAGAYVAQLVEPPESRRVRWAHLSAAAFVTMTATPGVLLWLDQAVAWIKLDAHGPERWITFAVPVAVLIGFVSWALLNAAANLLRIVRTRAPEVIATKLGVERRKAPRGKA